MPTWPVTLPQKFQHEGYQESLPKSFLRSDMGDPAQVRDRGKAMPKPFQGVMIVSDSQIADLEDFWATDLDGGALVFDFPDPDGSGTVKARFVSEPVYSALGASIYKVALSLEEMP